MFRELYFYYKKHKIIISSIYIQTTLVCLILGVFLYFSGYLDGETNLLNEMYEGKSIVQIAPSYNGKKGEEFNNNPNALNITKKFYNSLNNQKNFKFLTISDQYLYTKNVADNIFYEGYEDGYTPNTYNLDNEVYYGIKSIQINNQANEFFNLKVDSGRGFKLNDFQPNNTDTIPIILGNAYKKYYNLNDIIEIDYVGRYCKTKVIGFLEPNIEILTDTNFKNNLNRYIILPHIDLNSPKSKEEYAYQMSMYMNRIYSLILTENNKEDISKMRNDVEYLSQRTGFKEYGFLGEHMNISEYRNNIFIMKENSVLINSMIILAILLNLVILILIMYLQNKKRSSYYALRFMLGSTKKDLFIQIWIESLSILLLSYISYIILIWNVFIFINIKNDLLILIFLVISSIISTMISSYKIINKSVSINLNGDIGGE